MVNYLGWLGGARLIGHAGMESVMDRVTGSLIRTLDTASVSRLQRGMHFPVGWDPYFRDVMTVQDVLRYATQHYQAPPPPAHSLRRPRRLTGSRHHATRPGAAGRPGTDYSLRTCA